MIDVTLTDTEIKEKINFLPAMRANRGESYLNHIAEHHRKIRQYNVCSQKNKIIINNGREFISFNNFDYILEFEIIGQEMAVQEYINQFFGWRKATSIKLIEK